MGTGLEEGSAAVRTVPLVWRFPSEAGSDRRNPNLQSADRAFNRAPVSDTVTLQIPEPIYSSIPLPGAMHDDFISALTLNTDHDP